MKNWHVKMVFIGDCAHCTSPQLGQGSNLAIFDAVTLSHCINNNKSIEQSLTNTHSYADLNILLSISYKILTPFFQSDNKIAPLIRDTILPLMCRNSKTNKEIVKILSGIKNGIFSEFEL